MTFCGLENIIIIFICMEKLANAFCCGIAFRWFPIDGYWVEAVIGTKTKLTPLLWEAQETAPRIIISSTLGLC